ncbi:MAG: TetR/AcrR family transcriptional regulator C-terminal domain-containing protein [Smithellaceae bacterium]
MSEEVQMGAKFTLALSLKELVNYKPLDKITVRDIVKNCGAGRQTFYNHFNNKLDLINWIYEKNTSDIRSKFMEVEGWEKNIAMLFVHLKNNQRFYYNAFNNEERDAFLKFLYKNTADAYVRYIRNHFSTDRLTNQLLFAIEFYSYGCINTVWKWTDKKMVEYPDIMAKKLISSMPPELIKFQTFSSPHA